MVLSVFRSTALGMTEGEVLLGVLRSMALGIAGRLVTGHIF
jgi:hypothetical protein